MESVLSCSKTENYLAAWNRLNQWDFIKLYCYLPNFFKYRCSEHSSKGLERTKTEPYSEYVDSNVIGLKRKKPNLTVNTLILTSYLTFYRFIQKLGKKKKDRLLAFCKYLKEVFCKTSRQAIILHKPSVSFLRRSVRLLHERSVSILHMPCVSLLMFFKYLTQAFCKYLTQALCKDSYTSLL